ncbi:MAG TPA: hypothetical protein VKY32_00175 [Flavobacterium sp.]|nr:hypothetical protein [Flavobacterium sp.]
MLRETFIKLSTNYTDDIRLIEELWTEIEKNYSNPKRYYHTLQHLENIFIQLTEIKSEIQDWDTILFTLYYHDIVYNTAKSDNEEKSAVLAKKRLQQIHVQQEKIAFCVQQILATKSHIQTTNSDTNYFTDADLSILGQEWETYLSYLKNIKKEYAIYPDKIYNAGRKKVLKHFLNMDRIFKTDIFFNQFEAQAKKNLTNELNNL